jgi:tetratricopeptide (TPR) repeat protein
MMGLGRWSAAARDYQRCVELIDPELFAWEASVATFNAGEALALAGEHEEGIRWLERADRDKGAIGDLWGLAYVHAVRADLALELGHPGTMGFAQNSLSFATSVRDPKIRSRGRTCVGRAELAIDAFERAEHTLHKAMFEAQHCRAKPEAAQAAIALTELAFTRGRLRQAREQARVALQRAESTRAPLVLMPALFWMAVTHRGTPAAAEHLAAAHRQLDAQPGPLRQLDLLWADAWLAEDERSWLQVIEQAERLDARRHLASASEQLALCIARSGRAHDAAHYAERAASSYGAMGARRRRARCERFHTAMARRCALRALRSESAL